MKTKIYIISIFVSLLFLAAAQEAFAAAIYILPEQGTFKQGAEFSIDIKIDSEGESINAAEARVNWSTSVLEFVEVTRVGSVFNFWVEEPKSSSDSDSLSFIGGSAKGISGSALQILRIKFKAVSNGVAGISILDAAIAAADGKGTNVLSKSKGASFRIGPEGAASLPSATMPQPTTIVQPTRVDRKAVPATGLPQKPEVSVPLYPEPEKWQNYLGEMIALWNVPGDVTAVAVSLDHSPNTIPQKAEKELTTGKVFGVVKDGVWYVHVRFQNSRGWGPTAHYRIAIDTEPPLVFEASVSEGEVTDNPAPILRFETSDALSGLAEYQIKIDDSEAIKVNAKEFSGNFTLPLQTPGAHMVIIKAFDQAGNSVADSVELEILPIPSPNITFVNTELFSDTEAGLTIKGTALPGIKIFLSVQQLLRGNGEVAAKNTVFSDERGNWQFTFDDPLRNGKYVVIVQGEDGRGALSLVVKSKEILIKSKPIIQLGPLQLGKGGAALFLFFLLIAGFGAGVWFYKKRQDKLSMRVSFTESEVTKIFQLIREGTKRLAKARETPTTGDDEYTLKQLQENIQKMEGYLKKGLEKIKK